MSLFSEFSSLLPYVQSVRKLKDYLVFDVSFPREWKIPKKFVVEDKIVEVEATSEGERFFHFVSDMSEDNVQLVQNNIVGIIKYNVEREEKEKLFQTKIEELKTIFDKSSLKNLKSLKFEVKNKIELNHGEEIDITKVVRKTED
jgi:hypothetical protein